MKQCEEKAAALLCISAVEGFSQGARGDADEANIVNPS